MRASRGSIGPWLDWAGPGPAWRPSTPFTRGAAALLFREPDLGARVPGAYLRSPYRIAAGQRVYVLEPLVAQGTAAAGGYLTVARAAGLGQAAGAARAAGALGAAGVAGVIRPGRTLARYDRAAGSSRSRSTSRRSRRSRSPRPSARAGEHPRS